MGAVNESYIRHGIPDSWGAQTRPMGYRVDATRQAIREGIAALGNLLTPMEWVAPPPARLEQARARARG